MHATQAQTKKYAFTLIELSIVLVIIGLIVGGVLVGQDLIKAAEIRAQASQIESINARVNTFRLKYNGLPGDMLNATQFFSAASQPDQVSNGDGNRSICGYYYSGGWPAGRCNGPSNDTSGWGSNFQAEWKFAFEHLAAAGLSSLAPYDETDVSGTTNVFEPGISCEILKIKSPGGNATYEASGIEITQGCVIFGYEPAAGYDSGGHRIRLGMSRRNSAARNTPQFYSGLNPNEARMLDEKIDDGRPYSGSMVATGPQYIYRIPNWSGTIQNNTTYCGNSTNNQYITDTAAGTNLRGCYISIKAAF